MAWNKPSTWFSKAVPQLAGSPAPVSQPPPRDNQLTLPPQALGMPNVPLAPSTGFTPSSPAPNPSPAMGTGDGPGGLPLSVPIGSTGLRRVGGFVDEELLTKLAGRRAVRVYREMADNSPIVGAVLYVVEMLLRQVEWRVEPGRETPGAKFAAQFLDEVFEDMAHTWDEFIAEVLSMMPHGWSYFETVFKIRKGNSDDPRFKSRFNDGRVGLRKLSIRSQDTLYCWEFDTDGTTLGLWQMDPYSGKGTVFIPINRALLFRTTSRKNNPEGRSLLRNAYRPWYFGKRIEEIEAIGIERDLTGLPVIELPWQLMDPAASGQQLAARQSYQNLVQQIRRDEREGIDRLQALASLHRRPSRHRHVSCRHAARAAHRHDDARGVHLPRDGQRRFVVPRVDEDLAVHDGAVGAHGEHRQHHQPLPHPAADGAERVPARGLPEGRLRRHRGAAAERHRAVHQPARRRGRADAGRRARAQAARDGEAAGGAGQAGAQTRQRTDAAGPDARPGRRHQARGDHDAGSGEASATGFAAEAHQAEAASVGEAHRRTEGTQAADRRTGRGGLTVFRAVNKARAIAAARPTDAFETAFRTAMLDAAKRMREMFTVEQLARAVATRNAYPLTSDHRWKAISMDLGAAFEDALRTKVAEAGNAELRRIKASGIERPRGVPLRIRPAAPTVIHPFKHLVRKAGDDVDADLDTSFDLRNPFSEDFVRREGAMLVTNITDAARERIREVVEAGFVDGQTVQQTALSLRETLSLGDRLWRAVDNQVMAMTNAGASVDVVSAQAEAYATRLLSYRAELIARTETMTASNQGVLDSWRQAQGDGLIPKGMQKQWIYAEGSSRTCPICEDLGESDPVPIDEQFYSEEADDYFDRPPAHPDCRCTMGLVQPDAT